RVVDQVEHGGGRDLLGQHRVQTLDIAVFGGDEGAASLLRFGVAKVGDEVRHVFITRQGNDRLSFAGGCCILGKGGGHWRQQHGDENGGEKPCVPTRGFAIHRLLLR